MADPFLDALGVQDPSQDASAPTTPVDTAPLKAIVAAKAQKYGIPADMADRWVQQESSYNPGAKSAKGALGLTQLMPATAQRLGVKDPNDPEQNAEGGAQELSRLHTKYGDWPRALAAYNAGEGAVDKAGGIPNIPETQDYVKKIMTSGEPGDDFLSTIGADKAKAEAASSETVDTAGAGVVPFRDLPGKDTLTAGQTKTYTTENKGGLYDPKATPGSMQNKFYVQAGADPKDVPAGAYYVDRDGATKRAPGGPHESSLTAGLEQGVGDVATTFAHALPGSDDSEIKNALIASQANYGAKYGGDPVSGAGRFTGQVIGAAPLLAGGEGAVAPLISKVPALGEFLLGQGGKAMAPGVARFLTRGASLAAHGAGQGAGAAALTSSADSAPIGEQVLRGAEGGAVLGPVAPAVESAGASAARGAKSLIEPLTASGPGKIANRIVGAFSRPAIGDVNPGEIVPGSVPTLATATADPGLAQLERTVRLGPHADQFAARDAQNAQARSDFFDKLKGDEDTVQALKDARDTATSGAREAALNAQTKPADIQPVLDTIDGILKGPEGKRSEVVKALNAVRDNLFDADGKPETDAKMLYGVRKDLGDLLSPKASADKSGAQLAASQLKQVQGALDGAIQDVSPGFKEYLKNYSDLSKPIDEQQLLQSLKISDMRGNITLAKAQAALDKITAMRAKPGANPAKSVSNDTLAQLTALRDDLKRQDNINLARPIGPDTAGHFTTGGRLAQSGVPVAGLAAIAHHPVVAAAVGGAKLLYGVKDKQIMAEVANRLLNPEAASVSPAVAQAKQGFLKRMAGATVPAAGGMIANRLLPAQ